MLPPLAEKLQNFFGVFLQFQIGVDRLDCPLPDSTVERQAQAMIDRLAKYGALEVIRDG